MHKSQLIKTLKALNPVQWRAMNRFIRSPYFNDEIDKGKEDLLLFFKHIYHYRNNLTHPELEKERVFQAIFPGQPMIEGKVEKLMSALLKLLREFIAIEYAKNDGFSKKLSLAKFYRLNNWIEFEGAEI